MAASDVNFRTLDLNLLRAFDEVMAVNLTRAAASLAMTQPAVSNALRRLRDALGDNWWCVRAAASRRRREQSLYGLWCAGAHISLQAKCGAGGV